ncbi:hypothetical protein JWJ90_00655 [Desulfobulbus rhabdoformis]|uniref:hypothetical protein n=1 Tax=Desulfobulbus rhabdoformis TaxID=34032 RepID=UPI001964A143|nr:hypothetical protein [Desulfobulbus rhabdoformis]MBM9612789.1 hypothetical protein [Desulfobulbus rhabdoformis]
MAFTPGSAYKIVFPLMEGLAKEKYILCVANSDKYLVLFIEPEKKQYQEDSSQVRVSPADLPFLSCESFVNTAEIIICNPVTSQIVADYGQIPQQILREILTVVHTSKTLAARHIETIRLCLG